MPDFWVPHGPAPPTFLSIPTGPNNDFSDILETTELDALVVDDRGLKLLSPQVLQKAPKHIRGSRQLSSQSLSLMLRQRH